jgi:3-phenylpropionate/cinnamic acid dioxygenase small subunit
MSVGETTSATAGNGAHGEPAAAAVPPLDVERTAAVAAFLYLEAELLDDRRFDEWLALYAEDAVYWLPQGPEADPRHDVQLMLDDRRRLAERVLRLRSGHAYSQDPPSRTAHLVGNVRVVAEDGEGVLTVASVQLVTEMRKNRQSMYTARMTHTLVPSAQSAGGFLVRRKEARLVNADVPLGNVTFLI